MGRKGWKGGAMMLEGSCVLGYRAGAIVTKFSAVGKHDVEGVAQKSSIVARKEQ